MRAANQFGLHPSGIVRQDDTIEHFRERVGRRHGVTRATEQQDLVVLVLRHDVARSIRVHRDDRGHLREPVAIPQDAIAGFQCRAAALALARYSDSRCVDCAVVIAGRVIACVDQPLQALQDIRGARGPLVGCDDQVVARVGPERQSAAVVLHRVRAEDFALAPTVGPTDHRERATRWICWPAVAFPGPDHRAVEPVVPFRVTHDGAIARGLGEGRRRDRQ